MSSRRIRPVISIAAFGAASCLALAACSTSAPTSGSPAVTQSTSTTTTSATQQATPSPSISVSPTASDTVTASTSPSVSAIASHRHSSTAANPSPSASATQQASASETATPSATSSTTAATQGGLSSTDNCPSSPGYFVTSSHGGAKTVALTFDDGPAPADRKIAAILARYGVHATFYETGLHVSQYPGITQMLSAQGNLIADHSYDHDYPDQTATGWTVSYLTDQFTRTNNEISSLTGKPVCYVRPPGGYRTNVLTVASQLHLSPSLWSIDSEDWQQPGVTTQAATQTIIRNATATGGASHPVVLMHSAKASHEPDSQVSPYRGNTIAALPSIIEYYQSHGYTFVRMDGRS